MVRKDRPKFPNSYIGEEAQEYDSSKWMERNQKTTTLRCLELLFDSKLGLFQDNDNEEILLLDLGCGSGFSSEILLEEDFNVVSVDILMDMLINFRTKKLKNSNPILADIKELPLRNNAIDHIISVSTFNFIYENLFDDDEKNSILRGTLNNLKEILKLEGRISIEFYPESENDGKLVNKAAISAGFNGFSVQDNPGGRKEQNFLLLKKED